jgi:hypothetical protein
MGHDRLDYDEVAADYDGRYRESRYEGIDAAVRAIVRGTERVLDVGCGTGHWLGVAASEGVAA